MLLSRGIISPCLDDRCEFFFFSSRPSFNNRSSRLVVFGARARSLTHTLTHRGILYRGALYEHTVREKHGESE